MTNKPMSLAEIASTRDIALGGQPYEQAGPAPISDTDAKVVGRLLEQLKLVFTAWKHAFPTPEAEKRAGREWTRALVDANCTEREQLARGMRVARTQSIPFFPSPGMFIEWCELTPESIGLPSVDQALHEIARRRSSHVAVTLAARATRFERGTLTEKEFRPVFERVYAELVRRVLEGEDLEAEILKALPTREQVQHSPEYYHQAGLKGLALVKAKLGRRSA
ncbi:hypothetical protein GCM10022421_32260 [Oceanisphaera sediminis]|uniref:Replication protein P n=1 Tax=Oceanisphaera sediminis TaxID=981381 RepID=A0ABP7EPU7_9GAMM